jgi:hypothetical protein
MVHLSSQLVTHQAIDFTTVLYTGYKLLSTAHCRGNTLAWDYVHQSVRKWIFIGKTTTCPSPDQIQNPDESKEYKLESILTVRSKCWVCSNIASGYKCESLPCLISLVPGQRCSTTISCDDHSRFGTLVDSNWASTL